MKRATKVLSLILAAAFCFAFAGCSKKVKEPVYATSGETSYSSSLYRLFQVQALNAILGDNSDLTYKDALTATYDDQTGEEYIQSYADKQFGTLCAIDSLFTQKGLSYTDNEAWYYNYYASYYYSNSEGLFESLGISQDDMTASYLTALKSSKVFSAVYGKGGEKEIAESEKEALMSEGYYRARYIYLENADASGNALSDADFAALKEKAQNYYKRILAGEKIADLVYEYAKEQDSTATQQQDASYDYYIAKDDTNYPTDVMTALSEMKTDEARVVATDDYVVVLQKFDVNTGKGDSWESAAMSGMQTKYADDFDQYIADYAAGQGVSYVQGAVDYYTPQQLIKDVKKYVVKAQADAIGGKSSS